MSHQQNNRLIIWILGALATVTPFAIDLYLPAFAQIAEDMHTTTARVSLSVSSYFIGMALGQILYGPLLDRFGRKRPLYIGLIVFLFACIGCGLSTNVQVLVFFRFIQALGGSVAWVAAVAMVRDFFPVKESARIFSSLVLILGVSPLLAPTFGGFIINSLGWPSIFTVLGIIVSIILMVTWRYLPEGQPPDTSVSLRAKPMIITFSSILKQSQFYTYAFAGAFSFATLFIYVAGSPVIFMENYRVSPKVYGGIFALLSVGFIGGSQLNIIVNRKVSSEKIFRFALVIQVTASITFLLFAMNEWLNIYTTIAFLFTCLSCIGFINPNATALALAPFTRNMGSASALLGCVQIGVAALASSGVGLFDSNDAVPIIALLAVTSCVAMIILTIGLRQIREVITSTNVSPEQSAH